MQGSHWFTWVHGFKVQSTNYKVGGFTFLVFLNLNLNFGLGRKFWVGAKFLGSGENFRFGGKFWFLVKILGFDENFGFG